MLTEIIITNPLKPSYTARVYLAPEYAETYIDRAIHYQQQQEQQESKK